MRRTPCPAGPNRFDTSPKYTAWAVFAAGPAAGKDLGRRRGAPARTSFAGGGHAATVSTLASPDDDERGLHGIFAGTPTSVYARYMPGGRRWPRGFMLGASGRARQRGLQNAGGIAQGEHGAGGLPAARGRPRARNSRSGDAPAWEATSTVPRAGIVARRSMRVARLAAMDVGGAGPRQAPSQIRGHRGFLVVRRVLLRESKNFRPGAI